MNIPLIKEESITCISLYSNKIATCYFTFCQKVKEMLLISLIWFEYFSVYVPEFYKKDNTGLQKFPFFSFTQT